MKEIMRKSTVIVAVLFLSVCSLYAGAGRELSRGHKWIRDHEFQVMAVVEKPDRIHLYQQFGFTSLLVTNLSREGYPEKMAGFAVENELPWQWFYRWHVKDGKGFVEDLKKLKTQYPGLTGISVGDETNDQYFGDLAELIREARKIDPDILLYHALLGLDVPKFAKDLDLYRQYIQKAAKVMDVDVLMFDQYPFRRKGTARTFYQNLGVFREQALLAGKPYWNWLQAFGWASGPFDEPSESQLALQAYVSLVYGYKGLVYWTFSSDYHPYSRSLVDSEGKLTPVGEAVRNLIPDVKRIGNVLKSKRSTGVYYVEPLADIDGEHATVPKGITRFSENSSRLIQSAKVFDASHGFLIGEFSDEEGISYVMLVNTKHGYQKTSDQTTSSISLRFKKDVKSVEAFDCESGKYKPVDLQNKTLRCVELRGGTGRLYRIGNGVKRAGRVYDYTDSSQDMTNGDWKLSKCGSYFDTVFRSKLSSNNLNITHVHANGSAPKHARRGAYVWQAPAGEVITSVSFDYSSHGMCSVIYISENAADTFDKFKRKWKGAGTHGGQILRFAKAEGVKRIGLGFDGRLGTTYKGYYSQFARIKIETAPEP